MKNKGIIEKFLKILAEVRSFCEDNDMTTMPHVVDELPDTFKCQSDSSEHFEKYYVSQYEIPAGEAGTIGYRGNQALKLPDGRFLVWSFEMSE